MRERDENAYIRFFALWFAAGMTLGVLLLLAASHTGMKEGNSVRLFQAEAFFWKKNFRKGLLFLSSKGTVSTGICGTSLWIDGNRCVFCHCCRLGIWFSVWRLSLGCLSAERNGRSFILFLALFPQIFLYLAALFLMAAACSRMAETNHLAGGIQKKEYFCFGVRYFFALILLLWGILLESYVNPWFLAKIL